jgi:hypothetical protein
MLSVSCAFFRAPLKWRIKLQDVIVDPSVVLNRFNDGGKVIVEQDHGRLLATSVPLMPTWRC